MAEPVWAKHYQKPWEERSAHPNLPDWLRVACLAMGKHAANGHCPLAAGDLAWMLASVDADGVMRPSRNAGRAVRHAVDNGFLSPQSTVRCLVVPPHAVAKNLGNVDALCSWHNRKTRH